jgi:hypothetical protein
MRLSRHRTIFAAALLLLSLRLATPTPAHADTYQIVDLGNDNVRSFYGMDDSGNVAFSVNSAYCTGSASACYAENTASPSTTLPSLNWDYTSGSCVGTYPCSITKDGRTATISINPPGLENLSVSSGSDPSQLIATAGFAGIFAINGVGDIVFDNGLQDEWFEAFDLPPATPAASAAIVTAAAAEPATLLLLSTGLLAPFVFLLLRRRGDPATL